MAVTLRMPLVLRQLSAASVRPPSTSLALCVELVSADNQVFFEEGISEEVVEKLRKMGHDANLVTGAGRAMFGRGQVCPTRSLLLRASPEERPDHPEPDG